ncbi:MAG: acyltransferase family protein [Chthoniobacterales bacterium]
MPPPISSKVKIGGAQSLYLDLLRGAAALAVVFHHYSSHIAQVGHKAFPDVGQEAVMVFFVMSGFVIAMVADNKEREFGIFAIKRLSRFYSVVAPVAAILIGAYFFTTHLDPGAYQWWGDMQSWPAKLLATLTFSTESIFWQNFTLPGGQPMWSMSFEFWYYFVFAFAVLLPWRVAGIALAVLCALWIGPWGMLLFPVWLMGVATFHLFNRGLPSHRIAWPLVIAGTLGIVALQVSGLRYSVLSTKALFQHDWGQATYFPYYYLVGLCLVMNILGMLRLLDGVRGEPSGFAARAIRRTAHSAFFLYLTHIPVMFLLKAVFGGLVFPYFIPLLAWAFALTAGKAIEDLRFPLQKRLFALRGRPI